MQHAKFCEQELRCRQKAIIQTGFFQVRSLEQPHKQESISPILELFMPNPR